MKKLFGETETGLNEEDVAAYEPKSSKRMARMKALAKKAAIGIGGIAVGIVGTLAYQYISGNEVEDLGEEKTAEETAEDEVA
jgi:hypothetical protein